MAPVEMRCRADERVDPALEATRNVLKVKVQNLALAAGTNMHEC